MRHGVLVTVIFAHAVLMSVHAGADTILFPGDIPVLQTAIDSAAPGDTVLVQSGEWHFFIVYLRSGISLCSESGNPATTSLRGRLRGYDVSDVVLSGLLLGNGGVTCLRAEVLMSDVVLSSVSGKALSCESSTATLQRVNVTGNRSGIWAVDSELFLDEVSFRWNGTARSGAGLYCSASNVTMSDCLFTHNEAGWLESTNTWWAYGGEGGGACLENGSTLTAQDVVFDSNHTWYAGAGLALLGAGTSADLRGCTFVDNTTSTDVSQDGPRQSGAALFVEDASVALDDVKFTSNWCNRFGGAIGATGSCSVTAVGCVFVANHAFFGGAIYGDVYAVSCTFAGNEAHTGSSVHGGQWGSPVVANCILGYDPGGSEIAGAVMNHCCLADSQQSSGLCDGPEVFCADPLYCNTQAQDFSLCSDSPCLPTNNVWGELIGAFGDGCGPCGTSVLETSWGSIKAMFRGE